MHLEIHCPYCSGLVQVRSDNLGNLLQCPACPGKFRVPSEMISHQSPGNAGDFGNHGLSGGNLGSSARQPTPASNGQMRYGSHRNPQHAGSSNRPRSNRQHSAMYPVGPGMQAYAAYNYPNQRANQNSNMVLMVGGIVIGVILLLFTAMLVVLGSSNMNGGSTPLSTNVTQPDLVYDPVENPASSDPVAENQAKPPSVSEEADATVEPNPIQRSETGEFSFTWDPKGSVRRQLDSQKSSIRQESEDRSEGFRGDSNNYEKFRRKERSPSTTTKSIGGF